MESPLHVRWCPECEEEFRPEIGRCSDCAGPLVDRFLDERGKLMGGAPHSAVEKTPVEPMPEGYAELTIANSAAEVQPITTALDEAGVAFRVVFEPDPTGQTRNALGGRFSVCVHESNRIKGIEAIAPHIGLEPGAGDALAVEQSFDGASGYIRCPACGATITAGARECGECGLVVAADFE